MESINQIWFMVQIVTLLKFRAINQSNLILKMYVYVGSRHEHGWCQIQHHNKYSKTSDKSFEEKGIEAVWKGNGDDPGIAQNHYNLILNICWYCCQIQSIYIYISLFMRLLLSMRSLDTLFEFMLFLRHYDFPFFYYKYQCLDYENFVCIINNWWGLFLKFVIFYILISYHKGKRLFTCSSF